MVARLYIEFSLVYNPHVRDARHSPYTLLCLVACLQMYALSRDKRLGKTRTKHGRNMDFYQWSAAPVGRSLPTMRTQLRQILTKTGALHLRDLVRLLAGLPVVTPPGIAR